MSHFKKQVMQRASHILSVTLQQGRLSSVDCAVSICELGLTATKLESYENGVICQSAINNHSIVVIMSVTLACSVLAVLSLRAFIFPLFPPPFLPAVLYLCLAFPRFLSALVPLTAGWVCFVREGWFFILGWGFMDNKDLISKSGRVLGLGSWLTALVACWEETLHSP